MTRKYSFQIGEEYIDRLNATTKIDDRNPSIRYAINLCCKFFSDKYVSIEDEVRDVDIQRIRGELSRETYLGESSERVEIRLNDQLASDIKQTCPGDTLSESIRNAILFYVKIKKFA